MYRLTAADAIIDGRGVVRESDGEAVLAAASLVSGSPAVEIWTGTRMVAHLTAEELGMWQQQEAPEGGREVIG